MRTQASTLRLLGSLLPGVLAVGLSAAAWGDAHIYKTVDAQGNVVYTDKAPTANLQKTTVQVHEPTAADLQRVEQQKKALQAADDQRVVEAINEKTNEAQKQKQQRDKQARCQQARNVFYSLRDANRLYQRDAQGNRMYLPDEQADAKRLEAQKAMDAACGR